MRFILSTYTGDLDTFSDDWAFCLVPKGLKPFCGSGRPRILAVCDVDGVAEEAHLVAGGHKSTYVTLDQYI